MCSSRGRHDVETGAVTLRGNCPRDRAADLGVNTPACACALIDGGGSPADTHTALLRLERRLQPSPRSGARRHPPIGSIPWLEATPDDGTREGHLKKWRTSNGNIEGPASRTNMTTLWQSRKFTMLPTSPKMITMQRHLVKYDRNIYNYRRW